MRPSLDTTMIRVAAMLAMRAACRQRQVGCVLTDAGGRILSAGYNGRPGGVANCLDKDACLGRCEGLHAEINALLHCRETDRIRFTYITTAPCWHCVKALLATPCRVIIAARCNLDAEQEAGIGLWTKHGGYFGWADGTAADALAQA